MTLKHYSSLRSKVIVPILNPLIVLHMTSIVSNIVSLTAFEIV